MCEQVLNTGNIPVKGGITQGTVNTFNFILTCALPGRVRPRLVRVRSAPCVRATAMETRTLIRKL